MLSLGIGASTGIDKDWDLIIIGGGPAGMAAAIYGARYGLKTLILEKAVVGGNQAVSPLIENYPGFEEISGSELTDRMKNQVKRAGATIKEITEVTKLELDGDPKKVYVSGEVFTAKAIIIATGTHHRKLNVPGEEKLQGRGVSQCATCDAPLFKGKTVVVVGGGNTALTDALYIKDVASKTYLVHRRDDFRAEKVLKERVLASDIEVLWNSEIKEILGDDRVTGVRVVNNKSGEEQIIKCDGVFVEIGEIPESKIAAEAGVKVNESGEIITNMEQETNIPGVYAAGDVSLGFKQISVAVGQGATAANSAYLHIQGGWYAKK